MANKQSSLRTSGIYNTRSLFGKAGSHFGQKVYKVGSDGLPFYVRKSGKNVRRIFKFDLFLGHLPGQLPNVYFIAARAKNFPGDFSYAVRNSDGFIKQVRSYLKLKGYKSLQRIYYSESSDLESLRTTVLEGAFVPPSSHLKKLDLPVLSKSIKRLDPVDAPDGEIVSGKKIMDYEPGSSLDFDYYKLGTVELKIPGSKGSFRCGVFLAISNDDNSFLPHLDIVFNDHGRQLRKKIERLSQYMRMPHNLRALLKRYGMYFPRMKELTYAPFTYNAFYFYLYNYCSPQKAEARLRKLTHQFLQNKAGIIKLSNKF